MPADPWIVLAAGMVEGLTGYPERWHAWVPHPVSWVASVIRGLERRLNREDRGAWARRLGGVATILIVGGGAALLGHGLDRLLGRWSWGLIATVMIGSLGVAARSLHDHVAAVDQALARGDLGVARLAVGRIVGRDVADLDREGVATAALESLAESFCDGVIAPVAWFLAGGLAGLFAYKAVNTADSLIGHKEAPYGDFGWAAARADDLMNLIPARIAGALLALAGGRGWRVMFRDAGLHASPNAGWPEAALAGALRVRIGGPASYDGVVHQRPVFGDGRASGPADLDRGLRLYLRACAIVALGLLAGGLPWPR